MNRTVLAVILAAVSAIMTVALWYARHKDWLTADSLDRAVQIATVVAGVIAVASLIVAVAVPPPTPPDPAQMTTEQLTAEPALPSASDTKPPPPAMSPSPTASRTKARLPFEKPDMYKYYDQFDGTASLDRDLWTLRATSRCTGERKQGRLLIKCADVDAGKSEYVRLNSNEQPVTGVALKGKMLSGQDDPNHWLSIHVSFAQEANNDIKYHYSLLLRGSDAIASQQIPSEVVASGTAETNETDWTEIWSLKDLNRGDWYLLQIELEEEQLSFSVTGEAGNYTHMLDLPAGVRWENWDLQAWRYGGSSTGGDDLETQADWVAVQYSGDDPESSKP